MEEKWHWNYDDEADAWSSKRRSFRCPLLLKQAAVGGLLGIVLCVAVQSEWLYADKARVYVRTMLEDDADWEMWRERAGSWFPRRFAHSFFAQTQQTAAAGLLTAPAAGLKTVPTAARDFSVCGRKYAAASGNEVRAVCSGRVKYAGDTRVWGNTLIVEHGQGRESIYGYLGELHVRPGENVREGQKIALSGANPHTGEQQLYFEWREQGVPAVDTKLDFKEE